MRCLLNLLFLLISLPPIASAEIKDLEVDLLVDLPATLIGNNPVPHGALKALIGKANGKFRPFFGLGYSGYYYRKTSSEKTSSGSPRFKYIVETDVREIYVGFKYKFYKNLSFFSQLGKGDARAEIETLNNFKEYRYLSTVSGSFGFLVQSDFERWKNAGFAFGLLLPLLYIQNSERLPSYVDRKSFRVYFPDISLGLYYKFN